MQPLQADPVELDASVDPEQGLSLPEEVPVVPEITLRRSTRTRSKKLWKIDFEVKDIY